MHHIGLALNGILERIMIDFAIMQKGEPMADCMIFPDTVEEFMEQYKVVDTEQVYTNGAEFVPIFRMKQWFEHIDVQPTIEPELIRCKNCKHGMYDVMCKFYWCHGVAHSANWFCADAERGIDESD